MYNSLGRFVTIIALSLMAFIVTFNYGGCGADNEVISGSSTLPVQSGPSVTTNPATEITQTTAALNGTVNPNGVGTSVCFDYSTTTSYRNSTAYQYIGLGTTDVNICTTITGLLPDTTYNFRMRAISSGGSVYNGNNLTFTTTN